MWCALAPGTELPEPFRWSEEAKRIVAGGNAPKGVALAASCVRCHGVAGYGRNDETPHLAGQRAPYIYKQLQDYRSGARVHGSMNRLARKLSDRDMADIAAWYAGRSLPEARRLEGDDVSSSTPSRIPAPPLVHAGDSDRLLPPCAECHGPNGEGTPMHNPSLIGLQEESFVIAMEDFRSGARTNDDTAIMRRVAATLMDSEIETLARYYAGLMPEQ